MLLDAWAAYFEKARERGGGDLIEDDNFDLDAILQDLERKEDARREAPDDWEPAEQWSAAS